MAKDYYIKAPSATVTPSSLTRVNDTNVTLTLGGTPSTALLQAVSLTLGWTGTLADSRIASASTWNAKEPPITAGTTSQYWRGDKSWQTLDKTAVGLSNVDNTSDASKPISTATQTALNAKGYVLAGNLNGGTIGVGVTTYVGFGVGTINGVETQRRTAVSAGTVSGMYLRINATMTGTMVVTAMKNGSATAMTFTIAAGSAAGLYSTTSNTFSVADGDEVSIRIVQSTATSSAIYQYSLMIK